MLISGSGQIRFNQYTSDGPFSSTTPTYNLGVDNNGRVIQVSPNYAGSSYLDVEVDRIDYNSNTDTDLTGAASYGFVVNPLMTDIPNANKMVINNRVKADVSRIKINIGSFTQEMNVVTPVSMSQIVIGNTATGAGASWATYDITAVTLLNDPSQGDYLDMTLIHQSNQGGTDFDLSAAVGVFRLRPKNNVSTSTIYPIKNYYTTIQYGNLSGTNSVSSTIFGFWLDDTFRAGLSTGDEIIVEAKYFDNTGQTGETGPTISFITFATTNSGNRLTRQWLTRVNGGSGEVFQISNSDGNYGATQIFKFQYWQRSSSEYGLIPLRAYDSKQQGSQLN